MNLYETLAERGLIAQCTNEDGVKKLLNEDSCVFYTGYDPTADSLHVGHFLQLMMMRRLQLAGHTPIVLLGTGTTMIGDPSGKTEMRNLMTQETILHNAACFKKQMEKFIDFSAGKAIMVMNGDWLLEQKYVEFLRDVGVHFSVNKMLAAECFKSRLERGLSFIEFNYMLMQSFDYLHLFRTKKCRLQMGGNDQWANIIGGVELVRRAEGEQVFGMTFNLLTTRDGKKMGKTEKGAVWLNPEKTTPYEFYQYWRNIDDVEVTNCLNMLTEMPVAEINAIDMTQASSINEAKTYLAYDLTKRVHGAEEADKAKAAALSLFAGGAGADIPTCKLPQDMLVDGAVGIIAVLLASSLAPSASEARRLIQQGGVSVDGEQVKEIGYTVCAERLQEGVLVKKGKKQYCKVTL